MQSWHEEASLSGSCHSIPSPLIQIEDSYFTTLTQISDSYFSADELLEKSTQSMSSLEEMLSACIPIDMCTDDYWQGQSSDQCMRIPNKDAVDENMDCELHLFESLFEQNMESHATATSSAGGSNMHPSLLGETSANGLQAGGSTCFTYPSPVFSDASSLPPWTHNHSLKHSAAIASTEGESMTEPFNEVLSQMPTCENNYTLNSASQTEPLNGLFSQISACGYDYTTNSGSETEDTDTSSDNFFRGNAPSFAPIVNPTSYHLNEPVIRRDQYLLNMEAEAIVRQQHLEAPNHNPATQGLQGSEDSVSFLIENGTPSMDDGYVWRKYGQKNIKDKLYPRAYFRCAQPDCPIKKQTESSTEAEGSVLITYIGKHNHPR